jgi:hypothetical protein
VPFQVPICPFLVCLSSLQVSHSRSVSVFEASPADVSNWDTCRLSSSCHQAVDTDNLYGRVVDCGKSNVSHIQHSLTLSIAEALSKREQKKYTTRIYSTPVVPYDSEGEQDSPPSTPQLGPAHRTYSLPSQPKPSALQSQRYSPDP